MAVEYRECKRCGSRRAARFYVGQRGRICSVCRGTAVAEGSKDARLQDTYKITLEEWKVILETQGNRCFICQGTRYGKRKRPRYDVDHDHALEKAGIPIDECLRGLLCPRCNRDLLPACRDDIEILKRAIWYLENGRRRTQQVLFMLRNGYKYAGEGQWVASEQQ